MSDQNKTKGQLIEELKRLRGEVTALKKAAGDERRYAEEVRLLRTVIDNSPDWFFVKDRHHRFRLINQGFADLLGRRPEECIGKNDLELGFPEEMVKGNREKDIPGYWTDDQQVMDRGKPLINPYEPATLAGKNRVFHTIKIPIRDDDGHVWGLLGMVRDVTPSKQLLDDLGYRRTQLQTAAQVSRAATSILDPDELIRRVVDLARERFALYYVGLFLVDQTGEWTGEPGRWAVLRAGSGQAGQQMLAQGHMLKIGGESMIGWCVANKQARIALDIGEESVHFNNPLLPATRSEMALPLVSRGQIIGAMTVQSDQEAAFSDEDIAVFQTMADQLAIAIANARLLQETQQTVRELAEERNLLDTLMDSVPDMIFFKDAESRIIRSNRAHAKLLGLNSPEEAVGKTDFDLFSPEDAPRFYEEEQTIIQSGQPVVDRIGQTPDLRTGEMRWLSETKVPLMDKTGQAVGLVGIARDITERRQVEIELERRSAQLETAAEVSHAASSILDPDELIQQVGNLVQQRFDLYYAGLFLVDRTGEWTGEPGRWAVLRAGTGEAGRKMLEAGHKLEVGSESMIGWCIANAQARIALDVGEEAVRFVNPWLPETRSEMALPLISRGQVIGAVTIQSTQAAAFSQEDIAVLQAMANQLANSIENARLYTETKQRTQEISAALEVTTAVSSTLDLEEVLAVIGEQMSKAIGVDGCTISQWDKASDTIVTWIEMRLDDSETDEPGSAYALNDFPATKNVLESGRPFALSVGDPDVDPAEIALMRTYGHLSLLMLPLVIGDRIIGCLLYTSDAADDDTIVLLGGGGGG